MRIGVFTLQADATADPAIVAKHAEDLGFSFYWVPDRIILPVTYSTPYPGNPGDGPDPESWFDAMHSPEVGETSPATMQL